MLYRRLAGYRDWDRWRPWFDVVTAVAANDWAVGKEMDGHAAVQFQLSSIVWSKMQAFRRMTEEDWSVVLGAIECDWVSIFPHKRDAVTKDDAAIVAIENGTMVAEVQRLCEAAEVEWDEVCCWYGPAIFGLRFEQLSCEDPGATVTRGAARLFEGILELRGIEASGWSIMCDSDSLLHHVVSEEMLTYSLGIGGPSRPSQIVLLQGSRLAYKRGGELAATDRAEEWVKVPAGRLQKKARFTLQILSSQASASESSDIEHLQGKRRVRRPKKRRGQAQAAVSEESDEKGGSKKVRRQRAENESTGERGDRMLGIKKRRRSLVRSDSESEVGESGSVLSKAGGSVWGKRLRLQGTVTYSEGLGYEKMQLKTLRGKEKGVGYALSRLPGAGVGLFASRCFQQKAVICTYSGYESSVAPRSTSRSQYVWSDRWETIFIDARRFNSCYGRFINDSLDEHKDNVYIEVGSDGVARVIALRHIEAYEELYMSYGAAYWREVEGVAEDIKARAMAAYSIRKKRGTKREAEGGRAGGKGKRSQSFETRRHEDECGSDAEEATETASSASSASSVAFIGECLRGGGAKGGVGIGDQQREWGDVG